MIQRDAKLQGAHLLLVLVENNEVSINPIVLGNEVKQRDADMSKDNIIALVH